MKNFSLSLLAAAGAVAALFSAQPAAAEPVTHTDEFDAWDWDASWTELDGSWWTDAEGLILGPGTGGLIYYDPTDLQPYPFKVEADLAVTRASGWGGIAFHVQDLDNFYALRLRPDKNQVQFFRMVGGSPTAAGSNIVVDGVNFSTDETYRFGVVSMEAGEFEFFIKDLEGRVLFSMERSEPTLTGGYGGLHGVPGPSVEGMRVENFTVVLEYDPASEPPPPPPPSSDSPFDDWRALHFTEAELLDPEISGPAADPAGDGMANLVKYALGLDPWVPSRDAAPTVQWDMDRAALVFTAAEERPGVELALGVSSDLVEWESHVLDETYPNWGSVSLGDGREEITVSPPAAGEGRQFLRLEVRLDGFIGELVLLGEWLMEEIVEDGAEDHLGNLRNAVLDQSGNDYHLILGNRPNVDTPPDPTREPVLAARDTGNALSFDGVDDGAYAQGLWNMENPQQNYRFSFWFKAGDPLNGPQTLMITHEHFEVRMVQNSTGVAARLWLIRYPAASMGAKAFSHWFYNEGVGDTVPTWHFVEGSINEGEMVITIDGEETSPGTYDTSVISTPHHNAHYIGQTFSGNRSFNGMIDDFRLEVY